MADFKKPPQSIPSWQRASSPPSTPAADSGNAASQSEQKPAPASDATSKAPGAEESTANASLADAPLADQAQKWLQDPSIREATRDRKVAFLESKGVQSDDIQKLLPAGDASRDDEIKEVVREIPSEALSRSSTPATSPNRSIPPIVTYPEFLIQRQKPPPLITGQRLLYTAYTFGGLAALTYGVAKYIVAPMTDSLNCARHEFYGHTQSQLSELNSKLSSTVSAEPAPRKEKPKGSDATAASDDAESITSDPTELFHRDIATQTSPIPSRRPSAEGSSPNDVDLTTPISKVDGHVNRLAIMNSHLSELLESSESQKSATDDLGQQVNQLTTYLNEMMYSNPHFSQWGVSTGSNGNGKADDELEKVKREIRSMKGVFLGARNFPSSGSVRSGAGRVGA